MPRVSHTVSSGDLEDGGGKDGWSGVRLTVQFEGGVGHDRGWILVITFL